MARLNDQVEKNWCVYVLLCRNNYIYIGSTNNLAKRIKKHESGKGSKFVRTWRPFEVIKILPCGTCHEAHSLEYRLKQLKRNEKTALLELKIGSLVRRRYEPSTMTIEDINSLLNRTLP